MGNLLCLDEEEKAVQTRLFQRLKASYAHMYRHATGNTVFIRSTFMGNVKSAKCNSRLKETATMSPMCVAELDRGLVHRNRYISGTICSTGCLTGGIYFLFEDIFGAVVKVGSTSCL